MDIRFSSKPEDTNPDGSDFLIGTDVSTENDKTYTYNTVATFVKTFIGNATTLISGLMSAADKTKLDGVATGANNYVHPDHTGDVTSVADGAQTIANDAVTNAKAANMATSTLKGRITAGTGDPEDLTATQARTLLNVEDGATADMSDAEIKTAYENNANTNAFTDAEQTKLGFISVTQAVDLDTIESDTATNNAKVTNATHTGDVTGSTALTIDKTAITGKTLVTAVTGDFLLLSDTSDSGNLKKVDAVDFLNAAAYTHPNHTGDVTSVADGATTITSTAITGKTEVTAVGGSDYILISDTSDSGNIKKALLPASSGGDVVGPASAVNLRIAAFDGTTGKLLLDSGSTMANVLALANRANHTGTQLASTISDFSSAVAATAAVTANTAKVTNATHTGDATGDTVLTIANNAVTNAKSAQMAANTVKANVTGSTADPQDYAIGTNEILLRQSSNLGGLAIAASRIVARLASGDVKACTVAEILTLLALSSTDNVTFNNVIVNGQAYSPINALTDGATINTDCNLSNVHSVTLGGNRTLANPTNLQSGSMYTWIITQGSGGQTLAYGTAFKWVGGSAPLLSVGAGDIDVITGIYNGTSILCTIGKDYA
jgi:hypothetical protein